MLLLCTIYYLVCLIGFGFGFGIGIQLISGFLKSNSGFFSDLFALDTLRFNIQIELFIVIVIVIIMLCMKVD